MTGGPTPADAPPAVVERLLPLLAFGAVCAAVLFPVANTDLWWHLAAAREMIAGRGWLYTDPLAADVVGRRWIDLHWGFQLLTYGAHAAGGLAAVVLLKATVVGGAAALLCRATRLAGGRRAAALAALLVGAGVTLARYLVLARPVVFTLLYLALFLLVLERYRRGPRPRGLLWLLPVQVAWVNTQGLFLLGPALIGCYLAGDTAALLLARRGAPGFDRALGGRALGWLGVALLGTLAACLVSPYGADSFALAFELLHRIDATGDALLFSHNVSENVPPWLLERVHGEPIGHFKWVGAAVFGTFLLRWRRVDLARFLVAVALFGAALLANRNVLLFYWVAAPLAALNLAQLVDGRRAITAARLAAVCGLGLVALLVVGSLRGRREGPLSAPAPFRAPAAGVAALQRLALSGEVFSSVRYGSYLTWAGPPRWRPLIDGRLVLRSARQFAEHLALLDRPQTFERFRAAQGVRAALLPAAFPDRYLGLVAALYHAPRWRLLYTDGTQVLFVHDSAAIDIPEGIDLSQRAAVRRILLDLRRTHRGPPAVLEQATLHLARLLALVGALERADEVLATPATDVRVERTRRRLQARVAHLAGRTERARALAHALLRDDARDLDSLLLLALLDAQARRYAQSVSWARRALDVDPFNLEARQLLERIRAAR